MMTDDVTQMLSDCNAIVTSVMQEREPFFPNSEGDFYGKRGLEKTFHQVLKETGVAGTGRCSPRLYDFRHSSASLLLANHMPLKQIQEWLGHSDFSTTANIYAHLDAASKLDTADAMLRGLGLAEGADSNPKKENG